MTNFIMEKLKQESVNLTEQNIDKIAALFPSAITETKDANGNLKKAINFDMLKQLLSPDVVDGDECYEFTWVGKKQSIIDGNRPIRKTLRPAPEESKNWDTTENLYIEGDNLEVLKLLQGSYLNAVKMIYIDPPYNTGKDFVYRDNFTAKKDDYEADLGLYDEDENRLFQNNESNGRFHSDWCSMMYPRLQLARNLLTEDGVIFISIDDNEVKNLKSLCDEVFGEESFLSQIAWRKTFNQSNIGNIANVKEYILLYCRNPKMVVLGKIPLSEAAIKEYRYKDSKGKFARTRLMHTTRGRHIYSIETPNGNTVEGTWMVPKAKLIEMINNDEVYWAKDGDGFPNGKVYLENSKGQITNDFLGKEFGSNQQASLDLDKLMGKRYFDFPKPVSLLKHFCTLSKSENSIILDFFSGSSTTAHAVMQLNAEDGGNRKFIMVQLPEETDEKSEAYKAKYKNICEIGKERIRRAGSQIVETLEQERETLSKQLDKMLQAKPSFTASMFSVDEQKDMYKQAFEKEGQPILEKLQELEQKLKTLDTGFRVLKLDSTNMKDVYYGAGEYSQQMLLDLESNIKDDRNDLDLLYGVLLDWGVPLSLPHNTELIAGKRVHFVNDTDLVACFEENISETIVREIAKRKPLRVVFRDSSFANSPDKINVTEIFKTLSSETTVKVI